MTTPQAISTPSTTTSSPNQAKPGGGVFPQGSFRQHAADISSQIVQARQAQTKLDAIKQKYSSVSNLQKADKIEALKDTKLNPHLLDDPYDSVANSLHRWTTLAAKAQSGNYTPEQKAAIAGNYYDKEVAPFYAAMKTQGMPKDLWMKEAYGAATKFNIDHFYLGGMTNGFLSGGASAQAQLARAGVFAVNALGMAVKTGNDLIRAGMLKSPGGPGSDPRMVQAWHNSLLHMQTVDTEKYGNKGYFDTAEAVTKDIPILGAVSKWLSDDSNQSEFWHDLTPTKGFAATASSMTAETVTTLPLFMALGGITKSLAIGAKAIPYVENLTNVLSKIPGGNAVAGMLTAGGEGLAYGYLTRPNEDKDKAWQDALSFAALHTIFSLPGIAKEIGEARTGPRKTTSLGDELRANHGDDDDSGGGGGNSPLDKYETHNKNLELMVNENKRPATAAERYEAHKGEVANNIAATGVLGQKSITEAAFDHIKSQESDNLSRDQIRAHNAELLKNDPASASPMLSMASYIRGLLGDRKLSELKEGSKNFKYIQDRVSKLIVDAAHSMDSNVDTVKETISNQASKIAEGAKAQKALARIEQKLQDEVQKAGVKGVTPEMIKERAKVEYAKSQVNTAARAEKSRAARPIEDATKAAKKRRDVNTIDAGTYRERTRFTTNKKGEPAVSYGFSKEYKSYLQSKVPSWTPGEIRTWMADLSPEDFNKDLEDFFYPKDLKNAGVYFEHESTREGINNPNFLAFMYNYKDQMPKELGDEISRRIQDTPKFEKYFKGAKDVESQIRFYALQMYNHVDDFLASGRFPKEKNVFRSTQSDLLNPTVYQHELLMEREAQEKKNIKSMFRSPAQQEQALAAYETLADARRTQFALKPSMKRAEKVRELSDEISNKQIEQSGGSLIPWRF